MPWTGPLVVWIWRSGGSAIAAFANHSKLLNIAGYMAESSS